MKTLLNDLQLGTFIVAVGFSIWIFIKTKSYVKPIFDTWVACFICALLNIFLYPGILSFFGGERILSDGENFQSWGLIGLFAGPILGIELAIVIFVCRLIYAGVKKVFRKTKAEAEH
jgi:hypothetical protein